MGIQTSGEPEKVEPVCRGKAFRDGMAKLDLKGACLQVAIQPSYHQFQWQGTTYQFKCLPFGTTSVYKVPKASDRHTLSTWNQTDYLRRRHTTSPPVQIIAGSSCGTDMPNVRGTRPYDKQEEVSPVTSAIS